MHKREPVHVYCGRDSQVNFIDMVQNPASKGPLSVQHATLLCAQTFDLDTGGHDTITKPFTNPRRPSCHGEEVAPPGRRGYAHCVEK